MYLVQIILAKSHYSLSMPLYLFSHSSSLFLFFHPPLTPTLALYPPYASLSFLSLSFFSSLSLFSIPPPLHWPYIHPMPLYLFSLPPSSSLPFNLNLCSYGQLFVLVLKRCRKLFYKICSISS